MPVVWNRNSGIEKRLMTSLARCQRGRWSTISMRGRRISATPAWNTTSATMHQRGRRHVRGLAGHAHHRAGVQAAEHESGERGEAGVEHRPIRVPRSLHDAVVEEAELMAQAPHREHVHHAEPFVVIAETEDVDGSGDGGQPDEHDRVPPLVQPQEHGQQGDQTEVHGHEPQRTHHEEHGAVDPLEAEGLEEPDPERHPHPEQRQRRNGERPQALAARSCRSSRRVPGRGATP